MMLGGCDVPVGTLSCLYIWLDEALTGQTEQQNT